MSKDTNLFLVPFLIHLENWIEWMNSASIANIIFSSIIPHVLNLQRELFQWGEECYKYGSTPNIIN